ncbi:hypothetical protein DAEQUDRAFT_722057 [Daedalea quercina L-15889]|uniref:Uncharacterized protein n=1 Tax=Daedalea quercina L-15889 TaxID=1314783 RepID=A0A165THB6_9APHY|nr:hypothetical protein DAEQUDRAFT_722057 [Daedalea quercina L-15889]
MPPTGPDTIQLVVMEWVYIWVTPFPDEFWTKIIAVCITWPPTKVGEWFQFRRNIALRAAKEKHQPHPFRKPHEVVPVKVDGRTLDLRGVALGDGTKPWTDARFAHSMNHRFDYVMETWNERYSKMEYEARLVREYGEKLSRSEVE